MYVAVIVAVELLLMVPVVTLNVAEVEPAATVAVAGALSKEVELESATLAPPVGAGPLKFTVHPELVALAKLAGHDRELTVGKAPPVTTPPVADSVRK